MTPLPAALGGEEGGNDLVAWRLDREEYAATWDSGEGAYQYGGGWNSRGVRAIYCALDPATAILEVAVHKGFDGLDRVPHTLSCVEINDVTSVHVVDPASVPNPNWLIPGIPGDAQQKFGDDLLARYRFVIIPSTVSRNSWNLLFARDFAKGTYRLRRQERFALDTRLNPPR
ncbi:RES family NAD+ phosphorylase [soil metagenome]